MNQEHQLLFSEMIYKIILTEQEFIVHPSALNLLPLTKTSILLPFSVALHIENYQLYLDALVLHHADGSENRYEFEHRKVFYNGTILIGSGLIKEYNMNDTKPTCFSYQNVKELVFHDGALTTTVEQSRAMLRIRKNLELGLRTLDKSRDLRCINRFMNSSFIGDYKPFKLSVNRIRYLQDMKAKYDRLL